jgi:hypothetical protein
MRAEFATLAKLGVIPRTVETPLEPVIFGRLRRLTLSIIFRWSFVPLSDREPVALRPSYRCDRSTAWIGCRRSGEQTAHRLLEIWRLCRFRAPHAPSRQLTRSFRFGAGRRQDANMPPHWRTARLGSSPVMLTDITIPITKRAILITSTASAFSSHRL